MDTIETNAGPAGSDDVTSSPDTSVEVDTQPVETETPVDDGTPVETVASAPLLAGKYKSSEDLEKAYKELESKLGDLGQKASVADLIQEQYGVTPDQFRAQLIEQKKLAEQQMYQENPGYYAVQKVSELEQKIAERDDLLALKEVESELNDFIVKNPSYTPFKDDIFDFGLLPKYKEMSFEQIANEKFGKAIAKGQNEAYKVIDKKKMTQATGVSQAPPKGRITPEILKE